VVAAHYKKERCVKTLD